MKRFQQTQTCVLSFPLSQISFDKVFLILMLAAFQLLAFSMNANSNETLNKNTTIEELNSENSNFTTAEEFTCNGISFASYKEHDPACGADNGAVRVYVNNPNNYCLVYRLYNYTTSSWHTGYQTSRVFKDLPAGKYRVKMYRDLNCDINNVSTTCYTASDYFYLDCENLCSKQLTINNNGSDPARILWWVETGDQDVAVIQPGESFTTTSYDTYMWRAIDTPTDWNNLLYDEHVTTSGCSNQVWNISPNYTGSSCTGEIGSIQLTNGNESVTLVDGGTYQICDLPTNNYLEAVVSGNHESFHFNVDGYTKNENVEPYNYPAVSNNETWDPQVGTHNITGTLYSQDGSGGENCDEISLQINIVDCNNNNNNNNNPCSSVSENIPGFVYLGEYNGSKYFCSQNNKTWNEAISLVQASGGEIAIINDAGENNFLATGIQASVAWIGYTDENSEGTFGWYNGDPSTYNNWVDTEPNNQDPSYSGADYTVITQGTGDWYDRNGHNAYEIIMEIKCGGTPPTDCAAKTIVDFDMDGCTSFGNDGSNFDYSEFIPAYPNSANFTSVNATNVFRNVGAHSCIAGQGGSGEATCFGVGGLTSFQDNSDLAIRFEVTVNPSQTGHLTGLMFHEMAPDYYHHISGNSGTNNYPRKYGVRVTKNGNEIFKQIDINTTQTWSMESFDFSNDPDFKVTTTTTFKFELLSYDAVNIGGNLSAWDLDNIKIKGTGCSDEVATTVGDFVFNDINGNGIQENGEFGLPGVTVMLLNANGGMVATTTTNQDGIYTFTDVAPGDYKVKFPATGFASDLSYILTQPNQGNNDNNDSDPVVMQGTNDAMTAVFTVNEGDNITDIDAGYFIASKITGVTWEDKNGNGIQDADEPNIDGVVVMLLDENGVMVAQTTTSGNGVYTFDNLAPGDYKVKFPVDTDIASTNFTLTTPNVGGNDDVDSDAVPMTDGSGNSMTEIVSVANGATVDNLDAGYYAPATIGNLVFADINGNGIQDGGDDGESGLDGIPVLLFDNDGNQVGSTTTANGGLYSFTDLAPGTYKVVFPTTSTINGEDFDLTTPNAGGDDNLDSDAVPMNDGSNNAMSQLIVVESGDTDNSVDAGYYSPVSIGDLVFEDKNGNGTQDPGEDGIDGITVMLLDENGVMITSTTTSNGGEYTFTDLAPGTYKVKFEEATTAGGNNYELTTPNVGGNDNLDSDAVPMNDGSGNAMSEPITLTSGNNDNSIDAGYYIPASVGNYVFNDTNQNGIQDGDDTGIDGVTVMLLDANGDMIAQTTTVDGGYYEFAGLAPGTYKVKFPADYVDGATSYVLTFDNNGGNDNLDSDAVPMNDGSGDAMSQLFQLRSGENNETIDAGFIETAKLGNFVFEDVNENGIQDEGDLPLEGATVELIGTDIFGNSVNQTATTDMNGEYGFDNLVPGSYRVSFDSNDATFIATSKDANGNTSDDLDSDIDPTTGVTDLITLNAGDDNQTIDAGFHYNTVLPVKLISFEAQLVNNSQVVLRWATSSEEDNKHFIVERSADGRDFEPIGIVEGNGTSNVVNTYSLDDLDPFYGANYYRLKQIDYDGDSEYSQVETVVIAGNDLPDVIVYPNPVVRSTTLRVVTPFEQDAQIEIVSQSGQIVKTVTIAAGANSKQLDLSGYSAGVYFAYINFNGHRTLVYNIVKVEE